MRSPASQPDDAYSIAIVALVSYGRPEDVLACLAALARSTWTRFEAVVIENAGAVAFEGLSAAIAAAGLGTGEHERAGLADPARAGSLCVQWRHHRLPGGQPVVLVEAGHNLGYGGGVNLAIRCIGGVPGWRGLWVLNPDTKPEPDALRQVVEHAGLGPYGLVGCRLVFADQHRIQTRGGRWCAATGRARSLGHDEPADQAADVAATERRLQWVSGAAVYATRRFIETVGPMDEEYFLYCEDVDWSLRRNGFRLGYAHEAIVRHAYGTTIGSASSIRARSNLSVYLNTRNILLLTRKRFPLWYPLVVAVSFAQLLDFLIRGDRRVFAAACRGWFAGLRGETGPPARVEASERG